MEIKDEIFLFYYTNKNGKEFYYLFYTLEKQKGITYVKSRL